MIPFSSHSRHAGCASRKLGDTLLLRPEYVSMSPTSSIVFFKAFIAWHKKNLLPLPSQSVVHMTMLTVLKFFAFTCNDEIDNENT